MADSPPGPDYSLEEAAHAKGFTCIAGVDEAGRGPLAGPVVSVAVIFDAGAIPDGLNDSKKLSAARRAALYDEITAQAVAVSFAVGDVARIDEDNILNATMWSMAEAVRGLEVAPDHVLIDGNRAPALACSVRTVVKGDARCLSIAAASIIAKVTRDQIMHGLADKHPAYGWERNMGYGTREHLEALARHGPTPHHRRSFKPVSQLHLQL